jgi:hypothetical protein
MHRPREGHRNSSDVAFGVCATTVLIGLMLLIYCVGTQSGSDAFDLRRVPLNVAADPSSGPGHENAVAA